MKERKQEKEKNIDNEGGMLDKFWADEQNMADMMAEVDVSFEKNS